MTRILFGLGNPGREYEHTRHNAGWQVLDRLAEEGGASFKSTRLMNALVADLRLGEHVVRMIKPLTYMNLVGPVYLRALDVYDAAPEQALVLVDDFALDFGRLRFRAKGSAGSHNGLKSIQKTLAAQDYPRLKIGIGPAPSGARWADYVLKGYSVEQREGLPEMLFRGARAAEAWVTGGITEASNRYNTVPEPPSRGNEAAPDEG